jgi:hypothetical protein
VAEGTAAGLGGGTMVVEKIATMPLQSSTILSSAAGRQFRGMGNGGAPSARAFPVIAAKALWKGKQERNTESVR